MRVCVFPTAEAPSEARRALAGLAQRIHRDSLADIQAVIGELITVSVAHGATRPIDMKLTIAEGQVEGIVFDHGPGTRAIIRARERRDSSLVLRIIDGLVDDWGTNSSQTWVWFRMAVAPPR
jgi:anti-sigma regulatory factor (Ser/Thr protein kinase)